MEVEQVDCCSFLLPSSGCLGTVFWKAAGSTGPFLSVMSGGRMEMQVMEEREQAKETGFWAFQAWLCPKLPSMDLRRLD